MAQTIFVGPGSDNQCPAVLGGNSAFTRATDGSSTITEDSLDPILQILTNHESLPSNSGNIVAGGLTAPRILSTNSSFDLTP